MAIRELKIGCVMKAFANFMASEQEDISYVSYFVNMSDYKKISKFNFSYNTTETSERTLAQYFFYVILKFFPKKEKQEFCLNIASLIKGKLPRQIFRKNKIDPIVAPISAKLRNDNDIKMLNVLSKYELVKPNIKILLPELDREFYQNIYDNGRQHRVWSTWYVTNKKHIPSPKSLFDNFMKTLIECENWTDVGFLNFIYTQTNLDTQLRKVMSELEGKENKLSFCMFLVLKRQQLKDFSLPSLSRFYEETFDIYNYGLNVDTIQPYGYKEIHAHTVSDLKGTLGKKLTQFGLSASKLYDTPAVVSRTKVSDVYEDRLNSYVSKNKILSLPQKDIHDSIFRKAAAEHANYDDFFSTFSVKD